MAQAIVQEKRARATSGAFVSNVTAGNAILVWVWGADDATTGGVTDSLGNTYTQLVAQASAGSQDRTRGAAFLAYNITGGACTVTIPSAGVDMGFSAIEISGVPTTNPYDVSGGTTGVGTSTPLQVSLTTTATGSIYVGWNNEYADTFVSYTNGVTSNGHDAGHSDDDGYLHSVSASTQNWGANVTSNSNTGNVVMAVALKDAGGASPAPTTPIDNANFSRRGKGRTLPTPVTIGY